MKPTTRRNGLLLHPDDLVVGQLITIHHWRGTRQSRQRGPSRRMAWGLGVAHRLTAVNLPYLVAQPLHHPQAVPVILDVREVRLMKVSEEFAQAQARAGAAEPPDTGDAIPF